MTTPSPSPAFQGLSRRDQIERAAGAVVFLGLAATNSTLAFNSLAQVANGEPASALFMLPVTLIGMAAASVTAYSWTRLSHAFNALKQGGIDAAKTAVTTYQKTINGTANWWGNAAAMTVPLALLRPENDATSYLLTAGCLALATATRYLGKLHSCSLIEETGLTGPFAQVMSNRSLIKAYANHRNLQLRRGLPYTT